VENQRRRNLLRSQNNPILHKATKSPAKRNNFRGIKFITRGEKLNKYETSLTQEIAKLMCESSWEEDTKDLDKYITSQIADTDDMEEVVNKFSKALTAAGNKSFKICRAFIKTKTVSWWTEDLRIVRKRVNAFRRKYQRTKKQRQPTRPTPNRIPSRKDSISSKTKEP
jgi:hypothetical protein